MSQMGLEFLFFASEYILTVKQGEQISKTCLSQLLTVANFIHQIKLISKRTISVTLKTESGRQCIYYQVRKLC